MTTNVDLLHTFDHHPRWKGIHRPYGAEDVRRLRPSIHIEYSLARLGAERLGIFCTAITKQDQLNQ